MRESPTGTNRARVRFTSAMTKDDVDPRCAGDYHLQSMSDADERRTEQVPGALRRASPRSKSRSAIARRRDRDDDEDADASRKRLLLLVPLVMAAAAIVALVLVGMQDKGIYSKDVDVLIAEKAKFIGKPVRVEGNLVHGSLVKRETPVRVPLHDREERRRDPGALRQVRRAGHVPRRRRASMSA